MKSLTKRVIRQIGGDKRTIAMIIFAPILILTLISLLLGSTDYKPTIAIQGSNLPLPLILELKAQDANIIDLTLGEPDAKQYLMDNKDIDAVLSQSPSGLSITMYESSSKSGAAIKTIQSAAASLNPAAQIRTDFIVGNAGGSLFETTGYVVFGIVSFFLIFLVSGMALVRERNSGTLERMLMTPVSRRSVVGGYTAGYGLFAIIQAIVMVVFGIYVLGLFNAGNIVWVILIMLLLAISAVAFGQLLSIFANTEFQLVQFFPIAIIPQVFFSGIIPIDTIPYHLGNLCYIMPIYYGCSAIKEVMLLGNGFASIWPFMLALLAYIFGLSLLNTVALKKYRKL